LIHYHLYQKPEKTYLGLTSKKIIFIFMSLFITYGILSNYSSQNTHIYSSPENIVGNISSKIKEIPNKKILDKVDNDPYEEISIVSSKITTMLKKEALLAPVEKNIIVGGGDTLVGLLVNKADVSRLNAFKLVNSLKNIYDPKDITPGHKLTLSFNRNPALNIPKLKTLYIEKDPINIIKITLNANGEYKAQKITKTLYRSFKAYKGTIKNSLYVDAKAKGVRDSIIIDMIKMYSWNVDFQREIRPGDKFELLCEEYKTKDGEIIKNKGKIIYAKLTLRKRELPFYRFTDKSGFTDYYDDAGRSAKKALMKTPVNGARISSRYGMRRHPVLGYSKMHKGIDFAAPRGTPIYAAGDGVIEKARRFGSFGNYVKIRHRRGLETAYAHMQKFNRKIREGRRVKQGQIIGYIGTTGRSTGPHLHYEVLVKGHQVRPSSVKLPLGIKLSGKNLKSFKRNLLTARANFKKSRLITKIAKN